MEEILKLITNFGFPIVVAIYLLIRMEGKLVILNEAISKLTDVIADCRFTNNQKSNPNQGNQNQNAN